MSKYWQENPNHVVDWGEKGGLPIEKLLIGEENRPRLWQLWKVALLTDITKKAVTDGNGDFVLVGTIPIIYGGQGLAPSNAREAQLERELPGAHKPYTNGIINETSTANVLLFGFDGSNWFASYNLADLAGMTLGYLSQDAFGNIIATTGSSPTALIATIVDGNVVVAT